MAKVVLKTLFAFLQVVLILGDSNVKVICPLKWGDCLKGATVTTSIQAEKENIKQLTFSGKFSVTQRINSTDLQLTIGAVRCSLDMKECKRFIDVPISINGCPLLEEKDKFYTVFFDVIHPKLKCPVEAGNYTLDKITMDLTPLSFLPVDRGIWIITFRIVEGKSKKGHMCLNTQTKVVRRRVKD